MCNQSLTRDQPLRRGDHVQSMRLITRRCYIACPCFFVTVGVFLNDKNDLQILKFNTVTSDFKSYMKRVAKLRTNSAIA